MIDMYTHARIEGMYVLVDSDARHFVVNVLRHTGCCGRTHMMTCIEANTDLCAHIQVIFDKA